MSHYSIGALAARFRLRPSALRYYEDLGLLAPSARPNGRRVYGQDAVERLGLLRVLVDAGVSLEAIAAILDGSHDWRATLRDADDRLASRIRELQAARKRLSYLLSCPRENPLDGCPVLPTLIAPPT